MMIYQNNQEYQKIGIDQIIIQKKNQINNERTIRIM